MNESSFTETLNLAMVCIQRNLNSRGSVLFSRLQNCWKLADFGSSSQATSKRLNTTSLSRGTQGYRAPEVLEHPGHFNNRSDMFSFGCIIVELVTGQKLFESDLAVVRFAERPSWANGLPCPDWPNANFNEPLYRLRRLTAKLVAANPLSRPGSFETQIRLQDICNGVDRMVRCDDCGSLKIEWERCNHISLVIYVPTALGPVSG
jgi:serine/threonine protein kinase